MSFSKTVEIGRVVHIAKGKDAGQLAAIVDVIDANRALIDGPKIRRQVVSFQQLHLTKYLTKFQHSAGRKTVLKAWDEAKIEDQWKNSNWAKKLDRQERRKNMTDFDRYKLMRAKQARNKIVKLELGKLKRLSNSKTAKKPTTAKGKKDVQSKKPAKEAKPAKK
ncbi:hypothetical protein RvY_15534 [Ramazzottius varieornatus]|uniref:Large ribosomal subunit protein eL14 n=1 Tax=Ramazzottius varieornatus TaxID=947166 RepID=A0A1D1VYH6_RAMVA|nr:hypothetical protein RvY_15534 [Ramazzottius varieornatus]